MSSPGIHERQSNVAVLGAACGLDGDYALVATLEGSLRLHEHQPGFLTNHAQYLHHRTGGSISSLSHLIRQAAIMAILTRTERIDRASCSMKLSSTTPRRPSHPDHPSPERLAPEPRDHPGIPGPATAAPDPAISG